MKSYPYEKGDRREGGGQNKFSHTEGGGGAQTVF